MKRVILGLMAITMALSGNAQTQPTNVNLRDNVLNMKMDIRQMKVLGDEQLKEIGQRTAANPITSKALAASIVKNAKAGARAKGANNQRLLAEEVAKAKYTVQDTAMWESWEGWDGSFNWCPSSWSKKTTATVKEDGEATVCPTWAVLRGDGYNLPYATDGQYMMMCDFSEENQDEWIVSPPARDRINPTNFLSFDLGYAPLYSFSVTDLKVDEKGNLISCNYDLNKIAYDVEVLVTTKTRSASFNIEDYKSVFRLSDYARELIKEVDIETLEGQTMMLLTRWHHYKISLEEFAGSNIRVAFRYYGSKGSYVTLDAVRVSDMLPVALYDKPEGSFFVGFGFANNNPYLDRSKTVLMPAYTESLWRNYSNTDADRFEWTYVQGEEDVTTTDIDALLPGISHCAITWPKLKAFGGNKTDEYVGQSDVLIDGQGTVYHSDAGKAFVGGNAAIRYTDDLLVDYRVGNFDPSKPYMAPVSPDGGYVFGTPTGSWWTTYGYTKASGIANVYDAPASPYVFNTVSMPMTEYFNLGASIVCTIYRAQEMENGSIQIYNDEVLAQTKHTNEMFLGDPGKEGSQGYMLEFAFPQTLVIDHPIAIEISGFDNDNVLKLAPLTQAFNHDNNKGYAFVILKNEQTGDKRWIEIAGALSSFDQAGNMMVSHCIGMNAVFPYLHSTDGDTFEASALGETKTFNIDSYWSPLKDEDAAAPEGWTVECSDSWVKTEVVVDKAEHKSGIIITAEAMPSDVEGRVAAVTIKALGCEETIVVYQGDTSGIEGITVDAAKATNYTYNVAGQRMNGNANKRGLYIENRGGKYVKVIKE